MKQAPGRRFGVILLFWLAFQSCSQAAILKVNVNDSNCSDIGGGPYCNVAAAVNAALDGDEIHVAPGRYRTNLTISKGPSVTISIIGSGPNETFIDGGNSTRILRVFNNLVLANLTMENGRATSSNAAGGAINMYNLGNPPPPDISLNISNVVFNNNSADLGGAISTAGNVSVSILDSHFFGNNVTEQGGALHFGVLANASQSLVINNSSIHNNTVTTNNATAAQGGALYTVGRVYIVNSTLSANSAIDNNGTNSAAGAIYNDTNGSVWLYNTTISTNQSNGNTGGLLNQGSITALNSIIANNTVAGMASNCSGNNAITSSGYNLIGNTMGCSFTADPTDLVNATTTQLGLGPLRNNGGPGFSHALLTGSAAIDGANPTACLDNQGNALLTDQRGAPRGGTRCDIGAYEIAKEVLLYPKQGLVTTEMATQASLQIVLGALPAADIQIVSSSNNSEITVSPTTPLIFNNSNWDTVQTLTLTGVDDNTPDADQLVAIQLTSNGGIDTAYTGSKNVSATNWNINNITTPNIVVISPLNRNPAQEMLTTEQSLSASFGVKLATAAAVGSQVAVAVAVVGANADEAAIASTVPLVFTNANWNLEQTVTVQGLDDAIVDGDQVYQLQFSLDMVNTTDNRFISAGITAQTFDLTNLDDDTISGGRAGITVNPSQTPALLTSELQAQDTFTVVLNSQPSVDVLVSMLSGNPAEGIISSPLPLTFTPLNWDTPQQVTVQGVDDLYVDGDKNYYIIFDRPDSGDAIYRYIVVDDIRIINHDDEVAGINVDANGTLFTSEDGTQTNFGVTLAAPPEPGTFVSLRAIVNPLEHRVSPASLTFNSSDWNIPQSFTITGWDDVLADGNINYDIQVVVDNDTTNARYLNSQLSEPVNITNIDNETGSSSPGINISVPAVPLVTSEAGSTASFSVVLNTPPLVGSSVSLGLSSSDISEGRIDPGNLTFTDSNWATPQIVTITGQNDTIVDEDMPYTIVFQPSVSGDSNYNGLSLDPIAVINLNNDNAPGITISMNPAHPDGLLTSENGGSDFFYIALNTPPTNNVNIDISSSNIREGTVSTARVIFRTSDWNQLQKVDITGVNDVAIDGSIQYTIDFEPTISGDPNYDGLIITPIPVTNQDDDTKVDSGGGGILNPLYLLFIWLITLYRTQRKL